MVGMTWLIRTINWHRRKIAALLAALGMLALMSHLSGDAGGTGQVVVTTGSVTAGASIAASDVALQNMPHQFIPAGALTDPADIVGLSAAVPLSGDTVIQPGLLVSGAPPPKGRSLVPITVNDGQLRELLAPGLKVALVSSRGDVPGIVTADAVVHTMPQLAATAFATTGQAALVLVEVPSQLAPEVSVLGQSGQLSVFLTG